MYVRSHAQVLAVVVASSAVHTVTASSIDMATTYNDDRYAYSYVALVPTVWLWASSR